jgi:hypothetical protein
MTTKPPVAFCLTHVNEYSTRQLVAAVVQLTDEGVRGLGYYCTDPVAELADFKVTAYLSRDLPHAWGWRHEYQPYTVGLDRARAMSRVLGRVDRGLASLRHQLGHPDDLHTYLLHVAWTLDIRLFLLPRERPHTGGGRFRQVDTLAVRDWIRDMERQHAGSS